MDGIHARPDTASERCAHTVSHAFAIALRDEREQMNQRFAAQSHLVGGLDSEAFTSHLATIVDPIVSSVAEILPECARSVATELFDLSLELFAANALGPRATSSDVAQVWTRVLPRVPHLMSRDAAVVAGALSNAAYNVGRTPGARVEFWLQQMSALAKVCETVPRLLDCGTILAWRSGLVQYRQPALEAAASLPLQLATEALGLEKETSERQLESVLEHAGKSPWHRLEAIIPPSAASTKSNLQIVRTVGDFRGFGGEFLRPPTVSLQGKAIVATDKKSTWRLLADCYGSLLHRIGGAEEADGRHGRATANLRDKLKIDKKGRVTWNGARGTFPELVSATSYVASADTLAVSLVDSHRVLLIAGM